MFGFFKKLISSPKARSAPGKLGMDELARRLGVSEAELSAVAIQYTRHQIPKRSGGSRTILAPSPQLKAMQRRILHRLLRKLKSHPAATGFERGHSIVTNALPHVGQKVVIKLDLKNFFTSTSANRVEDYFRKIGWNLEAAGRLSELCTYELSLPQGAPTSPRLSNLVNYHLDVRLSKLAAKRNAAYSRYADDITFSGSGERLNDLIHLVKKIAKEEGYELHTEKKLRITHQHDRQIVTGIVVNQKANLPRSTRRKLRAIEHHLKTGKPSTISDKQLQGWQSLQKMVATQSTQK